MGKWRAQPPHPRVPASRTSQLTVSAKYRAPDWLSSSHFAIFFSCDRVLAAHERGCNSMCRTPVVTLTYSVRTVSFRARTREGGGRGELRGRSVLRLIARTSFRQTLYSANFGSTYAIRFSKEQNSKKCRGSLLTAVRNCIQYPPLHNRKSLLPLLYWGQYLALTGSNPSEGVLYG